jgi:hypothetical protein
MRLRKLLNQPSVTVPCRLLLASPGATLVVALSQLFLEIGPQTLPFLTGAATLGGGRGFSTYILALAISGEGKN